MLNIKKLTWDSDFFGFGIARLEEPDELFESLDFVDEFAGSKDVALVETLVDIKNIQFIELLESNGFHFVDTRVDFIMDLSKVSSDIRFDLAVPEDIQSVREIADNLFLDSRFFHHFFDRNKAMELFKLWAEKAVRGEFDNLCLKSVDSDTGQMNGFVTIKYLNLTEARIGLIGVSKNHLGKGIGTSLISSAISLLKEKNFEKLYIATQGKNIGALNLYIKSGFKIKSIQNWFYKIFN